MLLLLFFKIDSKNSLWKPHLKFWNQTVSYLGGHCIYIGIMLNNKTTLNLVQCAGITALVLYLKLFSYVTCLTCHRKSFPSGHCTVSVLTTFTNHFVSVSANENILRGFSFDFCTLKKNSDKEIVGRLCVYWRRWKRCIVFRS